MRFHCTYKITFPEQDLYYFGKHSTSNLNDGYTGSGVEVRKLISEGHAHFFKIVKFHDTAAEALNHEEELVGDKYITDPKCLNRIRGGGGLRKDKGAPGVRTPRKDKSKVLASAKLGWEARRGQKDSLEVRLKRSATLSASTIGVPKPWLRNEYIVDGISYQGELAVLKEYPITRQTLYNRVKSNKFPNWTKNVKS